VATEDLLIDEGRNREAVEAVRERLPQFDRESPLALVVEPVYSVDGRALVVASEQEEVLRVFDLVGQ
jgi:translation elongation factor EF-Tu-like GTPase